MLTSNVSSLTPECCHNISNNVIGGSKPMKSNVTMPTTSFLNVLCHRKFLMNESTSIFWHK